MTTRQREMAEEIKNNITVPMYFDKIIIPNMGYYFESGVDLEVYPVCKCPLHNEDTGSFRYFDYSNSFYCYGCTIGGDVISLHIQFYLASHNVSLRFAEAVEFLYKFFIEGNESSLATRNNRGKETEARLSTNVELVRYNKKAVYLEKYILETLGLSTMQKSQAYHRIDLYTRFVNKNKLNASEARDILDRLEKSLRSLDRGAKMQYISRKERSNE